VLQRLIESAGESGRCQTEKPCSRIPDRFATLGASRLIAIQCVVGKSHAGILRELMVHCCATY
jgi:hypothetical protein